MENYKMVHPSSPPIYSCLIKVIKIDPCLTAKVCFHLKKQWVAAPVIYNKCLSIHFIFKTWQKEGKNKQTVKIKMRPLYWNDTRALCFLLFLQGQSDFTVVNLALHLALWLNALNGTTQEEITVVEQKWHRTRVKEIYTIKVNRLSRQGGSGSKNWEQAWWDFLKMTVSTAAKITPERICF